MNERNYGSDSDENYSDWNEGRASSGSSQENHYDEGRFTTRRRYNPNV